MNRSFIIPILFFISFVFTIYFLMPKYFDFKNLEKEVSQKEILWQKKRIYFFNLKKAQQYLEKEKESLEKINNALPRQLSIASLLNFFEKKSSENGLFLEDFSITKINLPSKEILESDKKTILQKKEFLFSLKIKGEFSSLENFLHEIERSSRFIETERISLKIPGIKKTSDTEKGKILETLLTLKVYSQ